MPRSLDVQTHRILHHRHNIEGDMYCEGEHEKGAGCHWLFVPHYSSDARLLIELFAETERRGLEAEYWMTLTNLITTMLPDNMTVDKARFKIITATPEQHCRAFLAVIGDVNAAA